MRKGETRERRHVAKARGRLSEGGRILRAAWELPKGARWYEDLGFVVSILVVGPRELTRGLRQMLERETEKRLSAMPAGRRGKVVRP